MRSRRLVERALAEDIGAGDLTSEALFDADERCRALILLKEAGVVCGLAIAARSSASSTPTLELEPSPADGDEAAETAVRADRG